MQCLLGAMPVSNATAVSLSYSSDNEPQSASVSNATTSGTDSNAVSCSSSGHVSSSVAPPAKKSRLDLDLDDSTSTLRTTDSVKEGPATKLVKTFHTLLEELDCSIEDVIRHRSPLVSKYFVASDGLSASRLPVLSPPVQPKPSESSESVELWPLPQGSIRSSTKA